VPPLQGGARLAGSRGVRESEDSLVIEGFLATRATVGADVNLLAQVAIALGGGAWLAGTMWLEPSR